MATDWGAGWKGRRLPVGKRKTNGLTIFIRIQRSFTFYFANVRDSHFGNSKERIKS